MPKLPPLSPIARIFERDPQIAAWSARLKQEAALTAAIRRQLPRPLAERVRVAGAQEPVLELAVGAGAVAAVVRQRAPSMTLALQREGWNFTEIRVRVQVTNIAQDREKIVSRQLDAKAAATLGDLEAGLSDGPLKISLARWTRRARGR
jgi:Dna[CI] antecedent, DciA